MKTLFAIIALSIMTLSAQTNPAGEPGTKKTDTKKKAKKTADAKPASTAVAKTPVPGPAPKLMTIPDGATQNANGTYSFTDKAGKRWIFMRTPFGISKTEDMSANGGGMPAAPLAQYVTAFDNGETVKFERKTPFGVSKWEKKKTELTEEERAAYQRDVKPEQKPE